MVKDSKVVAPTGTSEGSRRGDPPFLAGAEACASTTPAPGSLLLATDFGPCCARAVDEAFALAAATGAKVHVVHAFTVTRSPGGPQHAMAALDDAREAAERKMRELVMPYRGSGLLGEFIVQMGDARAVIAEAAERTAAETIVLGRHRERGVRSLMFGSVAEALLRRTHARILVAPPPHDQQLSHARCDGEIGGEVGDADDGAWPD